MKQYTLLGPGPSNLHPKVREAATAVDMLHRQSEFIDVMDDVRSRIRTMMNRPYDNVCLLGGSGGLAVEAALRSYVRGKVLVIVNGYYGQRMRDVLVTLEDVEVNAVYHDWDKPLDLNFVRGQLRHQPEWLVFVHHETTTGLVNPLEQLVGLAGQTGAATFVDAVSSVGSMPIDGNADVVCFNSNKGLESVPGVGVVVSPYNIDSYTHGALDCDNYKDSQKLEYTPPTNAVLALQAALEVLREETPARRIDRYNSLSSHIRKQGQRFFIQTLSSCCSNTVTSFNASNTRCRQIHGIARDAGFILYGGKLPDQFRICNYGYNLTTEKLDELFHAIHENLR